MTATRLLARGSRLSALGSGLLALGSGLLALGVLKPAGAQTLVSIEEEIEIGKAANAHLQGEVPELRDARVVSYVRDVGTRLARAAPGPKFPYSFQVADRLEIDAFSLPGGPVWINRGALQRASNESQAAAVLAHEVAHIARRHGADRLTQGMVARWGLGLMGALLGNTGGAGAAQAAASLLTGGVFLRFSRDEEREADEVGVAVLRRAGWDARGMVEMFELLKRMQDGTRASKHSCRAIPRPRIGSRRSPRRPPGVAADAETVARSGR